MIRRKTHLLLLLFLFLLPAKIEASDIYFRHFGVKEGLSQINIFSIYQDETGAMWFGSLEGLNQYNGERFTVFHPSREHQGLTQDEIISICGNQKGIVYFQAAHDLIRFDIRKQKFNTLLSYSTNNMSYHNDTLWIVTNRELLYYTEANPQVQVFATLNQAITQSVPMHVSDQGVIYIGSPTGAIRIPMSHPQEQTILLPGENIKCFYEGKDHHLWVGTQANGIYKLSPKGLTIKNFRNEPGNANSLSNNNVRCIVEDHYGHLWIGTFYGLNQYTPPSDQWTHHVHQHQVSHSISHSSIFALYKDTQGGIWTGTYFGGVNYFHPIENQSNFYEANPGNVHSLSFPFVGKMQEDNHHNLWICTEGGGLNLFNRQTGQFTSFTSKGSGNALIGHNNLKCIWFQKETGKLYIGTHTGGLTIFDTPSQTSHTLKHKEDDHNSLPANVINHLQYHQKRLILSTPVGIVAMDPDTETFGPVSSDPNVKRILENDAFETFHIDKNDQLWATHVDGGMIRINLLTGNVRRYLPQDGNEKTIGRYKVVHILENHQGELYFSTVGSGVFKYNRTNDSFVCFCKENNRLQDNYCYYAAESPSHELVVLHSQGLSYLDTDKEELKHTHRISQMSFCQGSSLFFAQDGELFLGGTNGLLSLSNTQGSSDALPHRFYFDKLMVNYKTIQPEDDSHILSQAMPYTQRIELDHDQSSLTIGLASSNYILNNGYRYVYQLQGFNSDSTWIPLHSSQIIYTNLNPGSYQLVVREIRASHNDFKKISLAILIRPPFYANLFAYLFYILLVSLVLIAIIRFNNRQAKLKASLEFERKEKERIEELNQTKLRFFTNISHEFRTPLTLIMGQLESILQLNKVSPAIHNRMLRVYKNANQMRTLITELLDFRKQEQGYLKLKVEYHDLVSFTKDIYSSFYEYALKQGINYQFVHSTESVCLWFDPVQMQKVFTNLLSNAFKHTPSGGSITLAIHPQPRQVTITVKDNGAGIPEASLHQIFNRFYQVDGQSSEQSPGTGIGLALTKGIVELHKGNIEVKSQLNEGSCFTVTLQMGNSHFSADELQVENAVDMPSETDNQFLSLPEEQSESKETESNLPTDKPAILLVEDNEEILALLKEIFNPLYEVHTAKNGKEGLEQVRSLQPDIVVSDVMMPEMSGKEMCYKIKNSIDLSHIPVVLLTAQTSIEYTIEGYMYGADDYITKPFNVKLLISRCNNLVKGRKAFIQKFKNQQEPPAVGNTINQADQELMNKITQLISRNFENQEFNIDTLATELGMGRSKLYLRVKELTGLTPNELSLKLKLEEALRLLHQHPELNISEISDRLGFSSAQYFSKCFKSVYAVSPLAYRKSGECDYYSSPNITDI